MRTEVQVREHAYVAAHIYSRTHRQSGEESSRRACYYYLERLLRVPEEAATNTLRGYYEYLKSLLLLP
jgi:hypothetical protein